MNRNTTFGGRSIERRKRAKLAERLAVAIAVILLLTFVVKEILKDQLKDFRDSIVSAQNQFQTQFDQSVISVEILTAQQQLEGFELRTERNDPHHDYTLEIQQAIAETRQVQAQLHADFDGVSRLINALPAEAGELRQLREQLGTNIQKNDEQVNEIVNTATKSQKQRYADAKVGMVMALVEELSVVVLGDAAQKAAQRVQGAAEWLIKQCNRVLYFLGLLTLLLALYAAINRLKSAAQ